MAIDYGVLVSLCLRLEHGRLSCSTDCPIGQTQHFLGTTAESLLFSRTSNGTPSAQELGRSVCGNIVISGMHTNTTLENRYAYAASAV